MIRKEVGNLWVHWSPENDDFPLIELSGDIECSREAMDAALKLRPEVVNGEVVGYGVVLLLVNEERPSGEPFLEIDMIPRGMLSRDLATLFINDVISIKALLDDPGSLESILEDAIAEKAGYTVQVVRRGDRVDFFLKFGNAKEEILRGETSWAEVARYLDLK